jgi:phage shock protein C
MMTKRLQRPRNDRMIAGVAAGVAQYLGIDTTIVRLLFLLLLLPGGISPLIYVILWVLMPEEPAVEQPRFDPHSGQPLS